MDLFLGILLGLFVLVILVIVHELGHAIMARRNGVVVEEFGIGFPPHAYKRKLKNGILLSINWLPLGGFVKLQGEYDSADKKGDYGNATFWQKTRILLAGVTLNWLTAALLFTCLAFVGLPKILPNQFTMSVDTITTHQPVEIASVMPNHPADKAGLKVGDQITSFDDQTNLTPDKIINLSKQNKGKVVIVAYNRNGQKHQVNIKLGTENSGVFGVGLSQRNAIRSTWSAPIVGVATTAQFTAFTFNGLGQIFSNLFTGQFKAVGDSVAGPIGILGVIFPAARKAGVVEVIFLTAIISLTLAVMNILPIPSLDGGRWATMTIFKLFKKKLTREREEKIQTVGFIMLMMLVLLVTLADITKAF